MLDIKVNGNLDSLKESIIAEIEQLYDISCAGEFISVLLAAKLAELTCVINREIAVYINRKGRVLSVSVGNSATVSLPEVEGRRDPRRLSGVRCIHTHPGGDARLSPVDISSLIELRLDAMIAVGARYNRISDIYAGVLTPEDSANKGGYEILGPFSRCEELDFIDELISSRSLVFTDKESSEESERVILVGIDTGAASETGKSQGQNLLDELEELAKTAGVEVVEKILQKKRVKDPAFLIGRGKIEEIALLRQAAGAGTIIFDDELTGAQIRNIEELAGAKVIDRTMLILDIFAKRARSLEGKLQVELAQLNYRLPRLTGLGGQLSRLGGGIGTRGPGEKKLETDRRHIRRRMTVLERELKEISKRRNMLRETRKRNKIPVIALVGYTNAGKSTLMNAVCGSDVFVEDKLFATLDPTTRKFMLPDGREALLVDTVGFIRKLPHELIEAFKSTLEEAVFADALIHVADAADEELDIHISVVEGILKELGAVNKPIILALNKTDLLSGGSRIPLGLRAGRTLEVSAVKRKGIEELLLALADTIVNDEEEIALSVPYNSGWVMPYIRQHGRVITEDFTAAGVNITAVLSKASVNRLAEFVMTAQKQD